MAKDKEGEAIDALPSNRQIKRLAKVLERLTKSADDADAEGEERKEEEDSEVKTGAKRRSSAGGDGAPGSAKRTKP